MENDSVDVEGMESMLLHTIKKLHNEVLEPRETIAKVLNRMQHVFRIAFCLALWQLGNLFSTLL